MFANWVRAKEREAAITLIIRVDIGQFGQVFWPSEEEASSLFSLKKSF